MATARLVDSLRSRSIVETITQSTVEHTYGVGTDGAFSHPFGTTAGRLSGTVSGPGTSMSGSIRPWLSREEEAISGVNRQASAIGLALRATSGGASLTQVVAVFAPAQTQTPSVVHDRAWSIQANDGK